MKRYVIAYFAFLLPMLAIDAVWLTTMSKRFYSARIGSLLADSPKLAPAAVFYLIYALGASILVVVRAVDSGSGYLEVFLWGMLLGLFAYGTYDLTNQATLKEWSVAVTVVDLIWGALLTGVVSIISLSLTKLFT
jgi:uncharacterized membrane protein